VASKPLNRALRVDINNSWVFSELRALSSKILYLYGHRNARNFPLVMLLATVGSKTTGFEPTKNHLASPQK
jgi:hypothetical protein